MFENEEAYKEDWPHLTSIWRDDAEELIASLREVARAGRILIKAEHSGMVAYRYLGGLEDALDALPAWLLESEEA